MDSGVSFAAAGEGARKGNPAFPLKIYHGPERLLGGETSLLYRPDGAWGCRWLHFLPSPARHCGSARSPSSPSKDSSDTHWSAFGHPRIVEQLRVQVLRVHLLTYSQSLLIPRPLKVPFPRSVVSESLLLLFVHPVLSPSPPAPLAVLLLAPAGSGRRRETRDKGSVD